MESQGTGGSVRKNIALKLRDQGASPFSKVDSPPPAPAKKEDDVAHTGVDYSGYKWDHPLHLCGRPMKDPLMHLCENCSLPVLIYGRMKRCRHAFCRDCAKKAGGVCPKCQEGEQTFEEASMGSVYICTHGGGRYDNTGCGRSYLSQRDLEAHRLYRHTKDKGLGQTVMPTHLTAPPAQSSLAGFTLPPFFQSGMLPPRLPPGFPPNLPPPAPALGGVLSTLPNPLAPPGSRPLATGLLPPPPPQFAPQPPTSVMSGPGAVPHSVGVAWTRPAIFKS